MTDPRPELEEVISLAEEGELPRKAASWAEGALETAESILETVAEMQENGHPAPTHRQAQALRNIKAGALRWLHRED